MFPLARCEECGSYNACSASGEVRPGYPACHSPLRGVDLRRAGLLFGSLEALPSSLGAAARALQVAVLDRFARDHVRFSNVLEFSYSCDMSGAHPYRFSYAFPDYHADPSDVAASLATFVRPFGPAAEDACQVVLRAATSRAVAQLLFGYAVDAPDAQRVKLYLQFHDDASSTALALASRMLGRPLHDLLRDAGRLHLLAFDLGPSGLAGAKLYFLHDRLTLGEVAERVGDVPLAAELAQLGRRELLQVLTIHRAGGPADDGVAHASEIDFSLPDNDLLWRQVRLLPWVSACLGPDAPLDGLTSDFRLAVRRVSGSLRAARKLNVYYVLAEGETLRVRDRGVADHG